MFGSCGRRWAGDGAKREAARLRAIGYSQAEGVSCPVGSAAEGHWHVRLGPRDRQDTGWRQPCRHRRKRGYPAV